MEPGRLRFRITLQTKTDERDEYGQPLGWINTALLSADVRAITGKDFISGGAERTDVTTKVFIRYRADIRPTICRFIHHPPTGNGEVYKIMAALPDRNRSRLEVLCMEDYSRDIS